MGLYSSAAQSSLQNTPPDVLTTACVPAWQSPRSQSLSDLSFEFCPSRSLNSFPFLWACIVEFTAIRDSDSSPNTLQRARARWRSPLRMMDEARLCAGAFARGVSPRCSNPMRRSVITGPVRPELREVMYRCLIPAPLNSPVEPGSGGAGQDA